MTNGRNLLEEELLSDLDENKAIYSNYKFASEKSKSLLNWFKSHFPIAWWGRVDWKSIDDYTNHTWSDTEDVKRIVRQFIKTNQLKGNILIFWSDASLPVLEMDLQTAFDNIEPIVEIDWDTWIFSPEEGWCIEIYHEGEICFGYSPNHKKT